MITLLPQGKASPVNSIRIHEPMPLANPFIKTYKLTQNDVNVAYKAYLLNRVNQGDKLVIAELDRVAERYINDDLTLIGSNDDGEIILSIIKEALKG